MADIFSTSHLLWMIPCLPLVAAAIIAVCPQSQRQIAATLTIGSMLIAFFFSLATLMTVLNSPHGSTEVSRQFFNFTWFEFGSTSLKLGLLLDPLNAAMLVMVSFVGLLICIFSVGYMEHDGNFTRFFGFLALFSAAMLGLLVANSLLLLFICWELVGLASYLLIGFWYHKPSAVAAAQKAFITTRIGDVGLFLGMIWLSSETGTLLFYDNGHGLLEQSMLSQLLTSVTLGGMALSTVISVLIFCGAAGKSGQFPLHVWLPDAMEGPTPVSALIHAATMVAAGVFLVARMFPLFAITTDPHIVSTALTLVTWVGAFTAVFAACIAVAQNDIKRILAYSTVSQLGYMMFCLGVGGLAAAMMHLIAHAFFKALLFLGAGSVIHGCHEEQDIRKMGDLRHLMPITFATYSIGMMALAGFPFLFSGFWSKEEILHLAHNWPVSPIPFYMGITGAFLTAFYMTRQMAFVFFGRKHSRAAATAHESPAVMTLPLALLATGAVLLSLIATPAWPWFHHFITGGTAHLDFAHLYSAESLGIMLPSILLVTIGVVLGWFLYGRKDILPNAPDPLDSKFPALYKALENRLYVDEFYECTVFQIVRIAGKVSDFFDRFVWGGIIIALTSLTWLFSTLSDLYDSLLFNDGFDSGCHALQDSSQQLSRWQNGNIQSYLSYIGVGVLLLILLIAWI